MSKREWWIDFRDNGDGEVVHDSEPAHVQGECVHVVPASALAAAEAERDEALAALRMLVDTVENVAALARKDQADAMLKLSGSRTWLAMTRAQALLAKAGAGHGGKR